MKIIRPLLVAFMLVVLIVPIINVVPILAVSYLSDYYNTGYDDALSQGVVLGTAQTFTASRSYSLSSVKILVYKGDTPGTITVAITNTDVNGHPSDILDSNTFDGNSITDSTDGEWKEVTFTSVSISVGVKYAIRVTGGGAGHLLYWLCDSSSPSYSGGNLERIYTFEYVSDNTRDMMFETYGDTSAAPTVTTQSCSSVTTTGATGNGNITDVGGVNATIRGFAYKAGTTGDPTTADSEVHDDGDYGTGAYTKAIAGLSAGTAYRVRAYALNTVGTSYGTTVQLWTLPDAPTNVAATDGGPTKVTITWTKSTGATNYHVWRDAVDLGSAGDVATFDDTGAARSIITHGTASASDGTSASYVTLSLAGESVANGTTYTYKVVASNSSGNSADSGTDTGYIGHGALTYVWYKSTTDSDASYLSISGGSTDPYNDTGAPSDGSGRYYRCYLACTGASNAGYSTSDRGYRITSVGITLSDATVITNAIATLNGNITSTGGEDPTVTVYWGTTDGGTTPANWANNSAPTAPAQPQGVAAFSKDVTGLTSNTIYYFTAKATNSSGTVWATGKSFVTLGVPTVTTSFATSITGATATLNGNVTATGGENPTVVVYYGDNDGGTTAASWDSNAAPTSPAQPQGVASFYLNVAALNSSTLYYYSAKATNTYGTVWGTTKTFTTYGNPAIVVLDASGIANTTATLHSHITSDGGYAGACQVRFGYDTAQHDAVDFEDYDTTGTISAWVSGYSTDSYPPLEIASLTASTTYYFRVQAKNASGTVTSTDEETFDTLGTVSEPTNVKASPLSESISLSLTKGVGSSKTLIRFRTDHFPASTADGTQVYLDTESIYNHTGLTLGVTYFYSLWGEDSGTFSASPATIAMTTTAIGTSSTGFNTIDSPTNYDITSPDSNLLVNLGPFYYLTNNFVDSWGMQKGNAWAGIAAFILVIISIMVYIRSGSITGALIVMVVGLIITYFIGLTSGWWILFALCGVGGSFALPKREV